MQSALRHLTSIILASAVGMIVYCAALQVIWQQSINGEFVAVLLAAFTSLCVAYPLIYLPVLRFFARKMGSRCPYMSFPAVGVILGVVPVAIINLLWTGSFSAMFSPESQLFLILFTCVGLVLGGLFPIVDNRKPGF